MTPLLGGILFPLAPPVFELLFPGAMIQRAAEEEDEGSNSSLAMPQNRQMALCLVPDSSEDLVEAALALVARNVPVFESRLSHLLSERTGCGGRGRVT